MRPNPTVRLNPYEHGHIQAMNRSKTDAAPVRDNPPELTAIQETQSGVQRLPELDALRGIAAFSVVLWHFYCATFVSLPASWVIFWISRGNGAVTLFFILSGFVLSLPYQRDQPPVYSAFITRRICRIYLPYLVGIGLSILVVTFVCVSNKPGLSDGFNTVCGVPFDYARMLEHLFLIGNIHSNTYNNAIWSLIHEMRVSLIFPVLYWVVRRNKIAVNLILCVSLTAISTIIGKFNLEWENGCQTDYCFTLRVISFFIIGILLAQYRDALVRGYRRIPTVVKILALLLAAVLYRISMEATNAFLLDYGVACGGAAFIVSALGSRRISTLLRKPLFAFLGKISYAMYLNHLSVIYLVLYLCYPALPLWALCLVVIAITVMLSSFFWKFIERPSISLGRRLTHCN
jgi:peptidoglycan/LPS O-acetylase OafA/YrhL